MFFKSRAEREVAIRFYFLIALVLVFLIVLYYVPVMIGPLLISAVLAYLFNPLVDKMEGKGLPRWLSLLVIYLAVGLLISLIYQQSYMGIITQFETLTKEFPAISSSVLEKIRVMEAKYTSSSVVLSDLRLVERLETYGSKISQDILRSTPTILSSIVYFVFLVPFFTFFLIKDGSKFRRFILDMLPNRYLESGVKLINNINRLMEGFIQARLLETGVLTLIIYIGLLSLGLKYALLLSVIAGVFNLVPYIGPVIGSIPGVAVAYFYSGSDHLVWMTILLYFIAQMVDFLVIIPMVVSKRINVHPALVVVLLVVGNSLIGVLGMILAVPIFCIIKAIVDAVSSRITVSQ